MKYYSYPDKESAIFDMFFKKGVSYPYLNNLFTQPDGRRYVLSGYENKYMYLHLTLFRYNFVFEWVYNSRYLGIDEAKRRKIVERAKRNLKVSDLND